MTKYRIIGIVTAIATMVFIIFIVRSCQEPIALSAFTDRCLHQNRAKLETRIHCMDCGLDFVELPDIDGEVLTMKDCIMIVDPNEVKE